MNQAQSSSFGKVCLSILALCLLGSSAFVRTAYAQDDELECISDFSHRIPMDVSGTIHVPDFRTFFDQLHNHEAFSSEQFLTDLELLLASDKQLSEDWANASLLLKLVTEAHVMIWIPPQTTTSWHRRMANLEAVVALKIDETVVTEEMLNSLTCFLLHPYGPRSTNELTDFFCVKFVAGFLLIGSSKTRVERMFDSIAGKAIPEKKLSRDRRFASAMIDFQDSRNDLVFAFFRPSHFLSMIGRGQIRLGSISEKTVKDLPMISLTAGLRGPNDDLVVKTKMANTRPGNKWVELVETLPALHEELPPCDLNVKSVSELGNHLTFNYVDDFGMNRWLMLTRVVDYEKSKQGNAGQNPRRRRSKAIRLPSPKSDGEAIVWGDPPEVATREWESLVQRIEDGYSHIDFEDRKYLKAIKASGRSIDELGSGAIDNRGSALTRQWMMSGQVQDIVRFIDNMNAGDDTKRNLEKTSEYASWLGEQLGRDDLMRIEAGSNVQGRLNSFFTGAFVLKADGKTPRIKQYLDGVDYRKWKSGDSYRGNRYTLASWLAWNAAMEHCDDMVEVWCVKKPDGKLETALGMFFKSKPEK